MQAKNEQGLFISRYSIHQTKQGNWQVVEDNTTVIGIFPRLAHAESWCQERNKLAKLEMLFKGAGTHRDLVRKAMKILDSPKSIVGDKR